MVGDPGLILSVFAGLVFATRPEFTNAFFHLAVKRPTRGCGAPKARVRHTSTRSRLYDRVDIPGPMGFFWGVIGRRSRFVFWQNHL